MSTMRLRTFTTEDIPLGERLRSSAGWNQTPADWRRMLALEPQGGWVGELDGRDCGTVWGVRLEPVAWIGMMLVDESARGRGLGRALMLRSLEQLAEWGVETIRLDATPLGQPLYEKLGFIADFTLERFRGQPRPPAEVGEYAAIRALTPDDLPAVAALDAQATQAQRGRLLQSLHAARPQAAWGWFETSDRLAGFVLTRAGSRATQLGPCLATDDVGEPLLSHALRRHVEHEVIVDVPVEHESARSLLLRWGLTPERRLLRMTRGTPRRESVPQLWASSGPEKG